MTSLLPAILALAVLDAFNPASIATAVLLAQSGRRASLRMFVIGVYLTYLGFGLTLVLGPGAALRSVLGGTRGGIPVLEVALGAGLVTIGLRTRGQHAVPIGPRSPRSGSTT
jgi:hypothetical protein